MNSQRKTKAAGVTLVSLLLVSLLLVSLLLASGGLLISNNEIEHVLLGDVTHSLSWGPTVFRILLVIHALFLALVAVLLLRGDHQKAPRAFSSTPRSKTNWSPWLFLGLLSLVALGLRLWRLNTDLWFDELLTLLNYVRMPFGYIVARLPDQNNHIVFSLLSHASVQIFGESAWSVRLPSVLFGVMSLWALFLLGRRVVGTREALFACTLITLSYHHIWFSQNARGYMALLFFSLLTTWIWINARRQDGWGWWFAYAIAVAGGMWTHLTMLFVVSAHALVYLFALSLALRRGARQNERITLKPFFGLALSVSLTLQLYALALPEFLSSGLHEISLESEWTNPWWVVTETVRNLQIGFYGIGVVLGGAVMVGVGWWDLLRRDWQTALLMVVPPVIASVAVLSTGHNLWPRFLFFSMGFALLITIHGAMSLPQFISKRLERPWLEKIGGNAGFALASLMILVSALTVPRNYIHPKQDYTGAKNYVESQKGPTDVVVAVGLAGIAYRNYFAPNWSVAQTDAELNVLRNGQNNVWLIYTLPVEVKAYRKDVWETIQSDFAIVKVFPGTLGGGEVVVCRQISDQQPQLAMGQQDSLLNRGIGGK